MNNVEINIVAPEEAHGKFRLRVYRIVSETAVKCVLDVPASEAQATLKRLNEEQFDYSRTVGTLETEGYPPATTIAEIVSGRHALVRH